jgi:hypothetical protein
LPVIEGEIQGKPRPLAVAQQAIRHPRGRLPITSCYRVNTHDRGRRRMERPIRPKR